MNTNRQLLSEEDKKENLKKSKAEYYKRNKEKYKKWNQHNGFKNTINGCGDMEKLKEYLELVQEAISNLNKSKTFTN